MDDLVGVLIRQGLSGHIVFFQRRKQAVQTLLMITNIASPVMVDDVVGNPIIIDARTVTSAVLVQPPAPADLLANLQPIPPGFNLAELVPEAVQPPPGRASGDGRGERSLSAADQDPIETVLSNWGRRPV